MNTILDIAIRAGLCLLAISAFYTVAGSRWPTSYYLLDDAISAKVSRTGFSFALFRFVPLFVFATCALTYIPSNRHRMVVAIAIATGHLGISILRINPYTNPGPRRSRAWWCWQVLILFLSIAVVSLAAYCAWAAGSILPDWRDIVVALVTAVIVVIASDLAKRATASVAAPDRSMIDRSVSKYGDLVPRIALECRVDRDFAVALVVAEDLQ